MKMTVIPPQYGAGAVPSNPTSPGTTVPLVIPSAQPAPQDTQVGYPTKPTV